MSLSVNKISQSLITSVKSITGLPILIEPNKSYKPTIGTEYITTSITVGEPVAITIGQPNVYRVTGTMSFKIYYKVNTGYNSWADIIMAHFNTNANQWIDVNEAFKLNVYSSWTSPSLIDDKSIWAGDIVTIRYYYNFEGNI